MFWKTNYVTKAGFLVPTEGGDLLKATLYIYNNGTMIVSVYADNYEVTGGTERVYDVAYYRYPRFIVTE